MNSIKSTKQADTERLIRMEERMVAVHEYIVNEIRPAIKELTSMKETLRWTKAGVLGIYGIFGSLLLTLLAYIHSR